MASTTTNYGLTKPAYSDTADIAPLNTNMDKIDTALGGLDAGIAIVANGNTHAAISNGQYVYIRGHNSLAEGMYRATANIAANGTLSGSNVTSAVLGTAVAYLSATMPNKAFTLYLTNSENTWEKIWGLLNPIATGRGITVYVGEGAISAFTGGAITTGYWFGVGLRLSATLAEFYLVNASPTVKPMVVTYSNTTSSSPGTVTIERIHNEHSIVSGTYSDSQTTVTSGTYGDITVNFGKTMPATPNVIVGNTGASTSQVMDNGKITYVVISKSTTGFTVRMFNNGTIGRSPDFSWVAIA